MSENIYQRGRLATKELMQEHYADEWRRAPMVGPGRAARPGADLPGRFFVWEDGRRVEYHTAAYVARSFEHMSSEQVRGLITALRVLNAPFRAGFITYNLTFGLWTNPLRDYRRMLKTINFKGRGQITRREAYAAYFKEARAAWQYAKGNVTDPRVRQLLEESAILPPGETMMFTGQNDGFARTMERYGLHHVEPQDRGQIMRGLMALTTPVRWLGRGIRQVTRTTEALPKFAADRMLRSRGFSQRERAFYVRTRVGTPNVTDNGEWTPVTNELFIFSRVAIQGWRSDIEAATDPTTRAGYWWRTFTMDVVPKVFMWAAVNGLLKAFDGDDEDDEGEGWGARLERFYKRIPTYELQNFLIVPVGEEADETSPDGKRSIYVRIPHDDTARGAMGALWALLDGKGALSAASSAFDYGAGQVPGLAPSLELGGQWASFLGGGNPIDPFRDREIISRQAQTARAAGDMAPAYAEMGATSVDAFGMTRLREQMREGGTFIKVPFLNRVVKSSFYGLNEDAWQAEEREDGRAASVRLRYDDQTRAWNTEINRLRAKGEAGRSPYEAERYEDLRMWHADVYRVYDELAQEARAHAERTDLGDAEREQARHDEESARKALEAATRAWH
jgi:hypothetical protein